MGRAECFNAHIHRQTSVNRRKTSHCHDHRLVCVAATRRLVTSEFRSWRTTSTSTGRVCGWNIIATYVGNAQMLKWRMAVRLALAQGLICALGSRSRGVLKPSKVSPCARKSSILQPKALNMSHHTPYASYEPTRTAANARGDTVQHFCHVFLIPVDPVYIHRIQTRRLLCALWPKRLWPAPAMKKLLSALAMSESWV